MFSQTTRLQALDIGTSQFLTNQNAILNQLNNILNVPKNSLIFNRDFDLDIESYLFRQFNIIAANLIQNEIENGILRYFNGKMKIEKFDTVLDYTNRKYAITIRVNHPTFDEPQTIQLSYKSNG
jgi:phage baseplate assembly protein W